MEFRVADPVGEEERTKFAHYLWNAGVLMGEFVGGREEERRDSCNVELGEKKERDEWGTRKFADGVDWWLSDEEEKAWSVKGERVLELGAGV